MEATTTIRKKKIKIIALVTIPVLLLAAILLGLWLSGAWFYDADNINIDYSVAQLKFDLSSNHMYYYYKDNPSYGLEKNERFYKVIDQLNKRQEQYNAGLNTGSYDNDVKTLLKQVYPAGMIDELSALTSADYNDHAVEIYNKYSTNIEFPFKIKNMELSSMEEGKSIWYYQTQDILNLYYKEYVVQKKATGLSSSTMNVGVKLKGGTTFNKNDTAYKDNNFNDMVLPLTLKFANTGNTTLFLSMKITAEEMANKGILYMLLPYQYSIDSLGPSPDYRSKIIEILKAASQETAEPYASFTYIKTDAEWESLTYAELVEILTKFNACSAKTYKSDENATGNIKVLNDTSKSVDAGMLFWADYAQCKTYYAQNQQNKDWATGDTYALIKYNFTIDIRSSLKDQDLESPDVDYSKQFNKKETYEKFAGVSNFDVEGDAYFIEPDGKKTMAKQYMSGGYIVCNYVDPAAVNYISKFRFDIKYRGFSPANVRLRVIEQFTNTQGDIEGIRQIRFNKAADWVDNRANDLYFYSNKLYFSTETDVLTTLNRAKTITIPVITGIQGTVDEIDPKLVTDKTMKLKLSLQVEAVQPNRFDEFWGIDKIPETDAGVSTAG